MSEDGFELPEHMWRLQYRSFSSEGTRASYVCELCLELLVVEPDDEHPPAL